MATVENYADVAKAVYARQDGPAVNMGNLEGWQVQKWEWATWYGNGYQGGVFANNSDVIVGFSGAHGRGGASVSQSAGNARIGVNAIPNMAGSATTMVKWALSIAYGRQVSMCGHSLGGGLAEVVGNWAGLPFISFNGPGMASYLKMPAFNLFRQQQLHRASTSNNTSDAVGICFTVRGDVLGSFGAHVGHEIVVDAHGAENTHSMDAIIMGIGKERLRHSPREFLSNWPSAPR
ncbi:hypothetical protein EOD42_07635 [Rhodovarius crocodyli]|uniref:DUF2974 domain-containing protein n=1 Tax=Rhodovarius crocodyli TaxID=1979269 RepID=A0A437MJ44_9PROT|nr:hypothetical protein [Rhodovarius crocodyli]RVT97678.1 hypothetical protein EOD42_07635 [Rhodovarius crocodyli]